MQRTKEPFATALGPLLVRERERGGVDVPENLSIRQLALRAGVSPSQVSRIEAGQVTKPSHEVLIALARALNRNPLPLLIVAGHITGADAQRDLRRLFREGAELPDEWGDWASFSLGEVGELLEAAAPSDEQLRRLAADVFIVQETVETLWNDADQLVAARGTDAETLREVIGILRSVRGERREQWLEHGRALERLADLEYLVEVRSWETDDREGGR